MLIQLNSIRHADALAAVRERVVGIDREVPVLGGGRRAYVNLDNAASTPVLREVLDAVNEFMPWYSSVHRGAGFKSRVATQAYEDARRIVAGFVGADDPEHVVLFGKNTTEAINKLAARLALQPGDVVLVSQLEHHSNDLPWRATPARVLHVGCDALGRFDEAHFERLLREHAGRVRLLAVTGGSNVTGTLPDVHRLAEKVHAAGAQIFVDCAQLAPHRAIRVGALDDPAHLDYVALSAHKMYAPFGTGALIGRRDTFERGAPEQRGGGTIEFVSLDDVEWAPAAEDRDEAGSPNVVGAVAMAAAVQALQRIGMDAIARHEAELTAYALQRFSRIEGLTIYGDADPARAGERLGVITFNLEGLSHGHVAAVLSTEFGIGVRNGCFCAHPYLIALLGLSPVEVQDLRADMIAGDRRAIPGMVRVSFGSYNSFDDIDAVADALERIARGEVRGRYVQDRASGEYAALGFQPDLRADFGLPSKAS
ncbi:aminotransferase class V-fold PLP-dependent enzyme [Piscinibacter sp. XHJ-5]|uniref:aminotransferase class V-fold PLP-dependent enzyme n=1 Tax=Piscinibacter sp. XHJ-5 TaxID=3037797 RepID=UPI002452BD96|nr:aminotransferase class V-fold PLP-dependent enzyme [Piscinibacter sp. XHJ-5]